MDDKNKKATNISKKCSIFGLKTFKLKKKTANNRKELEEKNTHSNHNEMAKKKTVECTQNQHTYTKHIKKHWTLDIQMECVSI